MELTLALGRRAGLGICVVGGLQLVAAVDTQAFLDACAAAGIVVVGIEGFYLHSSRVRPDLDAIADFSKIRGSAESIREARAFLATVGRPEMFFDFTLAEESSLQL